MNVVLCSVQLYDNVFRWWFLCALERDCIAPTTDLFCDFRGPEDYGKCHRYDQSALNILLANYFQNDYKAYFASAAVGPVLSVERGSSEKEEISVCDGNRLVFRKKPMSYF